MDPYTCRKSNVPLFIMLGKPLSKIFSPYNVHFDHARRQKIRTLSQSFPIVSKNKANCLIRNYHLITDSMNVVLLIIESLSFSRRVILFVLSIWWHSSATTCQIINMYTCEIFIIPHATSCGGYNVFDPSVSQSVRQSCFSC